MANPSMFGIASVIGIMPGTLPKPVGGGGTVEIEAFCNNSGASATVQIQGSISGLQWNNVGSAISCSGITPQFQATTSVNYSYYRASVTAIAGTGALVSVYMGS